MWLRLLLAFGVGVVLPVVSYSVRAGDNSATGTGFAIVLALPVVAALCWLAQRYGDPHAPVLAALLVGFPVGGYIAARVWLAQTGLTNEWKLSLSIMLIESAVLAAVSLCVYLATAAASRARTGRAGRTRACRPTASVSVLGSSGRRRRHSFAEPPCRSRRLNRKSFCSVAWPPTSNGIGIVR